MSETFIKHLRETRANTWEQAKELLDAAATDKRDLTSEEEVTYKRMSDDLDTIDDRVKDLEASEARALATDAALVKLMGERHERSGDDVVTAELRSVLSTREKPASDFTISGKEMTRALTTGTGSDGAGNTFAGSFLAQLIQPLRMFTPLFDAGATVITTASGEEITVPRLKTAGSAAAQSEATQLTGTDPTFDQVKFGAYKFGDYRGLSRELVEDSAIDIEALVVQLIGENIGYLLGSRLSVGTGSGQTSGVVTAATAGVTGAAATAGAFTMDNLIDLQESVLAPYQPKASWIMSGTAVAAARKLKDTNGQYLWQPSTQLGAPDVLLGRAVRRDPYMAAPAVAAKSVAYGDFSRYWIRMVNAVRIERSDQALFGTDQIAFRGVLRADGGLTDAGAVKTFVGGAVS